MTMIKKLAMAASVAAVAVAAPAMADPYTAPSVAGTATVRLYDAISLLKVQDIDFGTVIRDSAFASGTRTITMSSAGATDCGVVADLSCTGTVTEGHFTIKGDNGSDMSVTLASGTYDPVTGIMQLANGTDSVDLDLGVSGMTQDVDSVTGDGLNSFSVTGTGSATDIKLYGALTIGDSSAAANGVYVANFTLTADYK